MKKSWMWLLALCLMGNTALIGCGGSGGAEGDDNDPAAETDDEQMNDESGEME